MESTSQEKSMSVTAFIKHKNESMSVYGNSVGEIIKTARNLNGMTQNDLSRAIERSSGTVGGIEGGLVHPSPDIREKLFTLLGLPHKEMDELIDKEKEMKKNDASKKVVKKKTIIVRTGKAEKQLPMKLEIPSSVPNQHDFLSILDRMRKLSHKNVAFLVSTIEHFEQK